MTHATTWLASLMTVAILVACVVALLLVQHRHPTRLARSAHASLREDWFAALSKHRGSEILAVQTLRNSMMSATHDCVNRSAGTDGRGHAGRPFAENLVL